MGVISMRRYAEPKMEAAGLVGRSWSVMSVV